MKESKLRKRKLEFFNPKMENSLEKRIEFSEKLRKAKAEELRWKKRGISVVNSGAESIQYFPNPNLTGVSLEKIIEEINDDTKIDSTIDALSSASFSQISSADKNKFIIELFKLSKKLLVRVSVLRQTLNIIGELISESEGVCFDIGDEEFIGLLRELSRHKSEEISFLALRIAGTLLSQTENKRFTEFLLFEANLKLFLQCESTMKDSCWILSNLAAGQPSDIQELITQGYISALCLIVRSPVSFSIQKEAIYALCNACNGGTEEQLLSLIKLGTLDCLTFLLNTSDQSLLQEILRGIDNLLSISESEENESFCILRTFDEIGGRSLLDELCSHSNSDISNIVECMLDKYYSTESAE